MGISKSIKGLFGKTKKKKDDVTIATTIATHDAAKSPKAKPKNRNRIKVSNIAQLPTKSCLKDGRVPYGAYNSANAKLVTADGDYPSNYEHYSNFEPKKTGIAHGRNPGILKGANIDENGTIPGGLCQSQKLSMANQSLRGSKINLSDSCSDFGGSVISSSMSNYEFYQPMANRYSGNIARNGPVRANSVSDLTNVYNVLPAKFGNISRRPSSRQGQPMMPNPYQQWNPYMNQYQGGITRSPSMSSMQSVTNQAPEKAELAVAMQKMEHCMALLNSLQMQNPNVGNNMGNNLGNVNSNMSNIQNMNIQNNYQMHKIMPRMMHMPANQMSHVNNPVQRSRTSLQPQPEFQERELRKKRRLRKKSDLSKFDMSDLKKKLESITHDESSDDSSKSNHKSDGGFYDVTSGATTPEKEKSDDDSRKSDSGDDSSDSGVQTPPMLSDSTGSLTYDVTDNAVIDDVTREKAKLKGSEDKLPDEVTEKCPTISSQDITKSSQMSQKETKLLSSLNLLRANGRTRTQSQ